MVVKGVNDRRGTCVNRCNEGSRGLGGLARRREEGLSQATEAAQKHIYRLRAFTIIVLCCVAGNFELHTERAFPFVS